MTERGASSRGKAGNVSLYRPTLIGFTAILMWSLLALLTAASGKVPPFQLAAMTFALGGLLGAVSWIFRKGAVAALRQPRGSLGARDFRPVRLSRAVFLRAAARAAGRSPG